MTPTPPAPDRPALVLGVDGGGTSTEAWLAEPGGRVLGRGKAGPSNGKAVGNAQALRELDRSIRSAFDDAGLAFGPIGVACLGLAGFGRPDDQRVLREWSDAAGLTRRLVLVTDGDLVVAAGTPGGWGAGVIAGTGSIAVGRALDGQTARAGGWGHLIGDEGSAYAVALEALRTVARRADGRDPTPAGRDHLTERLCRAFGADTPAGVVPALYAPGFDRTRIAALAPVVLDAAGSDPDVAGRILPAAGRALAEQVMAVARALGWTSGPLPLAMAGGFLLAAAPVTQALLDALGAAGYQVTATPVPEPVLGAVVIARRAWHDAG
jgi:N-acetylglucosamine kinase-like BadF-type ATPase